MVTCLLVCLTSDPLWIPIQNSVDGDSTALCGRVLHVLLAVMALVAVLAALALLALLALLTVLDLVSLMVGGGCWMVDG